MAIKDCNGKKLIELEEISQKWKEYCETLYDSAENDININIQNINHRHWKIRSDVP